MIIQDFFVRPHLVTIRFYDGRNRKLFRYELNSEERYPYHPDLADITMIQSWKYNSRTIQMGISVQSEQRQMWTEKRVAAMEKRIRNDFADDGYTVRITRVSSVGRSCSAEFRWHLKIRATVGSSMSISKRLIPYE